MAALSPARVTAIAIRSSLQSVLSITMWAAFESFLSVFCTLILFPGVIQTHPRRSLGGSVLLSHSCEGFKVAPGGRDHNLYKSKQSPSFFLPQGIRLRLDASRFFTCYQVRDSATNVIAPANPMTIKRKIGIEALHLKMLLGCSLNKL